MQRARTRARACVRVRALVSHVEKLQNLIIFFIIQIMYAHTNV